MEISQLQPALKGTEYIAQCYLDDSFFLHRSGFTTAEVEPLGVYQFTPDSSQIVIAEDIQTITLYVQRLYGSRGNTTYISYTTVSGSAVAGEDFLSVPDGRLVFNSSRQTNASFQLSILDDLFSEPDESFQVNLNDVQVIDPDSVWADVYPRLNPQQSVATVTILASDVTGGILSIGPGLIQVPEDKEEETQQERKVVLRVRRSSSVAGDVRVRVQAYGGLYLDFNYRIESILPLFFIHCFTFTSRGKLHSSPLHSGSCWYPCKGAGGLQTGVHHSVSAGRSERDRGYSPYPG